MHRDEGMLVMWKVHCTMGFMGSPNSFRWLGAVCVMFCCWSGCGLLLLVGDEVGGSDCIGMRSLLGLIGWCR